ncbi:hypothetical protein JCM11491_006505 [Sporobolomyces phaffii]
MSGQGTPTKLASSSHLLRLPSTPRTVALVETRSRHALQVSTSLTISHFATLLAELNSSTELDNRIGFEQDRLDKIEQFREDFMTGALMRVKPLELLDEATREAYSDGAGRSSLGGSTAASSSQEADDTPATGHPRRILQMPLDAVSRGVIAEATIKTRLAREGTLISHKDYSSIARAARKAMKKTVRLQKPVYVSPGLLDAVDWTDEYRQRGWAAPGIRWGPFKPDLIKFEQSPRRDDVEGRGEGEVTWEVVEVKYAGKTRDVIYTNYKVQAIYYHLTLERLFSAVPLLRPSHKVTFFVSHDPLAPHHLERPLSVRTTRAFVEHHLFVLLPEWLRAVRETEWKRLQDKLAEKVQSTTRDAEPTPPTFLEKLQASQRKPAASSFTPRRNRTVATPLVRSHTAPPLATPSRVDLPSPDSDDSFCSASSSPLRSPSTGRVAPVPELKLPPLPVLSDREEAELEELFERVGIQWSQ